MLFTAAKVSHLALLPQGAPERTKRVVSMVQAMDAEGFGNCTNTYECEAVCPAEISASFIAKLNREYTRATGLFREQLICTVIVVGTLLIYLAVLDNWYHLFVALSPLSISTMAAVSITADWAGFFTISLLAGEAWRFGSRFARSRNAFVTWPAPMTSAI